MTDPQQGRREQNGGEGGGKKEGGEGGKWGGTDKRAVRGRAQKDRKRVRQ